MRSRSWAAVGIFTVAVVLSACSGGEMKEDPALLGRAERVAQSLLIVDTHIDFPERADPDHLEAVVAEGQDGHFDLQRARRGGLNAAFMAIYVSADLEGLDPALEADKLIALVESMAARWPEAFAIARSPAEVRAAVARGLLALPMGLENGSPIGALEDLKRYRDRGISYVTLTHSRSNQICDSSFDDERPWHGLSPFGRELIAEMNRLGVMIDVSHLSDEAFDDVLKLSATPVIASHSSCRAFTPGFERNLDDVRIQRLAENGGVLQLNFGAAFLTEAAQKQSSAAWDHYRAFRKEWGVSWGSAEMQAEVDRYKAEHAPVPVTVADLVDHVDHAVRLVGIDHVGLGSDFDGVDRLPEGIDDVSKYPVVLAELLRRGYSERDLAKICGENVLRVWDTVRSAAGLGPS